MGNKGASSNWTKSGNMDAKGFLKFTNNFVPMKKKADFLLTNYKKYFKYFYYYG